MSLKCCEALLMSDYVKRYYRDECDRELLREVCVVECLLDTNGPAVVDLEYMRLTLIPLQEAYRDNAADT